jgi:1-acyl-sn-glycerol-3-phosphate acyltransferase
VVRFLRGLKQAARIGLGAALVLRRLEPAARRALARGYSRGLLEALGLRLVVRGDPLGETVPVLTAANHISWLDVCAVGSVNAAPFVAKAEVRAWPIVPRIASLFGTFFIVRTSLRDAVRVKSEVAASLRAGTAVTVFPESTTSSGAVLGRFYPALFQAAVETAAWVQPVAIRYRDGEGFHTEAPAFLGDMTIVDSLRRILAEEEIVVELTFCPPLRAIGRSRRELASAAHAAIAEVLGFGCAQVRRESAMGDQNAPTEGGGGLGSPTPSPQIPAPAITPGGFAR